MYVAFLRNAKRDEEIERKKSGEEGTSTDKKMESDRPT